jgi:organic hydroperoxide reductase OsmC/OhrA
MGQLSDADTPLSSFARSRTTKAMALEMKHECERCKAGLEGSGRSAWICSYECTYCGECASAMERICPNCSGELVRRPRRGAVTRETGARQPHRATVRWERNGERFVDNRYSRVHDWSFDGGTTIKASASPHVVRPPLSDPAAVDPEEAFIAGLSSCHMLWFLNLAALGGIAVESYEDHAEGFMQRFEGDRWVLGRIVLHPRVVLEAGPQKDEIARLHEQAHRQCFLANALVNEIEIAPLE